MSKKLLGLLFFIFSQVIWADELVIVTTISSSKKRFVINQGTNSNIVPNQTRAFSTDNISLMCYAVETSPDHSLWQVQDQNAFIPFLKNQFVQFYYFHKRLSLLGPIFCCFKYNTIPLILNNTFSECHKRKNRDRQTNLFLRIIHTPVRYSPVSLFGHGFPTPR